MNQFINSNQQPIPFNVLTHNTIHQINSTPQPFIKSRKAKIRPRTAAKTLSQVLSPQSHNLIYVQRQSVNSGKHTFNKNLHREIDIVFRPEQPRQRRLMDQSITMSASLKQQRIGRKSGGKPAGTASLGQTQSAVIEPSPPKRGQSKAKKQDVDKQYFIYNSQDQGRASLGVGPAKYWQGAPAQFSANKMVSAFGVTDSSPGSKNYDSRNSYKTALQNKSYGKNKDLSPRQLRMLGNASHQSQKQARFLASSNQHSYLDNLKEQGGPSAFGAPRVGGTSSNHKRNLVKKPQYQQNSRPGLESETASGYNVSQATQKFSRRANQHDYDSKHALRAKEQSAADYLKQQKNLYALNPRHEGRSSSKKNAQTTYGGSRVHNAKSIGLFDLRKHLKKNAKRVLSSKYRMQDNHTEMFQNAVNAESVTGLIDASQHNMWGPLNQTNFGMNQSNSGNLEHLPRSSMTFSHTNLHANTDAVTTMTTTALGQLAPPGARNTHTAFNSKSNFNSNFHSLEDEYIQTLKRNQNMSANSQFDKFLQEKFLANEAARRAKADRQGRDKFVRRNRSKTNEDHSPGIKLLTKDSQSPRFQELHEELDYQIQRPSGPATASKSPISISNLGNKQAGPKRQIDTNQMLTDLKESLKARDSVVVRDSVVTRKQMSIGEKMSLTGEIEEKDPQAKANNTIVQSKEPPFSQVSESGQETYSSKQYKVNPLLLDDQVLKQVTQPTSEHSYDFRKEAQKRDQNNYTEKEIQKLRESFNADYHIIDSGKKSNRNTQHAVPQKYSDTEPGKEPIVLQLEPRSLKSKEVNITSNSAKQRIKVQKPTQFNEYLKVEDIQQYRSRVDIQESASDENPRVSSEEIVHDQQDFLKNQMLNRPGSKQSKQSKFSTTNKSRDTMIIKTTPQLSVNNQSMSYGAPQDKFVPKKLSKLTSLSSAHQPRRNIKQSNQFNDVGLKQKFMNQNNRTLAEVEQDYSEIQNTLTNQNLPPQYLQQKGLQQAGKSKSRDNIVPILKEKNLQYSNSMFGQLSSGLPLNHLQRFNMQNSPESFGITRIRRQNLHKIPKQQFGNNNFNNQFKYRPQKMQKTSSSNRKQTNKYLSSFGKHQQQANIPNGLGPTNLHKVVKQQQVSPNIIRKINKNTEVFEDREVTVNNMAEAASILEEAQAKRSISMMNKATPKQKQSEKTMRKSKSQAGKSNAQHFGKVTPHTPSIIDFQKRTFNQGSQGNLEFVRNDTDSSLNRPKTIDQSNILDIQIKNTTTPDRQMDTEKTPLQYLEKPSFDNRGARSNNDHSSPATHKRISGGKSSRSPTLTQDRQRSYTGSRKKKDKNTKSEAFLHTYARSVNRSVQSNYENYNGSQINPENIGERCDVLSDAQFAVLKYKYPRPYYQSVMGTRPDNRPSMRDHLNRTGKRPVNHRPQRALSEFPQFERDVRESAGGYTAYAKSLYRTVGVNKTSRKRASSAKAYDIRGIKYKFKVVDIAKYTDTLKYGVFNWPVRYCTIGRKMPNPIGRKETLVKEIHFDTLLNILKETDWKKTPLYAQFEKHGRWVNDDEEIYNEIEVGYLSSTLHQMDKNDNLDEFDQNEGQAIIKKHWGKTMSTLQKLMCMMNMMYYWEKLKLQYQKVEAPGSRPTIFQLEKLLSRCKKLYSTIDSFMKIFKLIQIKELRDHQRSVKKQSELTDKDIRKDEVLIKRLTVAICLLIKENPVLPLQFLFGDECLLERLKKEKEELKQMQIERKNQKEQKDKKEKEGNKMLEMNSVPFDNVIQEIDKNVYVKTRRSITSAEERQENGQDEKNESLPTQIHD